MATLIVILSHPPSSFGFFLCCIYIVGYIELLLFVTRFILGACNILLFVEAPCAPAICPGLPSTLLGYLPLSSHLYLETFSLGVEDASKSQSLI